MGSLWFIAAAADPAVAVTMPAVMPSETRMRLMYVRLIVVLLVWWPLLADKSMMRRDAGYVVASGHARNMFTDTVGSAHANTSHWATTG